MRELRFVGPGEDSDHVLVETVEGDEQFSLLTGEELRSMSGTDTPAEGADADPAPVVTAPVATLSPREIQIRIRRGDSAENIADTSGMTLEKVLRFARPVIDERARITVEARRARARRSTPEGQLVEFGDAVDSRFSAHGVNPELVRWDAYRREDSVWVVSAAWSDDADRIARWAMSLTHRLVTPLDETAADLLSDRPIRPVVHAVPPLLPGANDGEAFTSPLPKVVEEVYDQDARVDHVGGYETPPLPLRLADPIKPRPGTRQQVPPWDDILLGVRRKTD
jgi:hypothetical protein